MVIEFNIGAAKGELKTLEGFGNERIAVTNKYLKINNKPCIPIMGELQYSRVPKNEWERTILLMKEAGVNIIASYVFWNHHEWEKGNFLWEGNLDLREFIQLCEKHEMDFFLRIGPWVHGESRNGGFPDWLVEECKKACENIEDVSWDFSGVGTRRDVEPYMSYVRQYMIRIIDRVKDLKNIIGIQIENELSGAPDYLNKLKQIAVSTGIRVPIYTATGWGNAKLDTRELIPIWGAYCDEPWASSREDFINQRQFFFLESPEVSVGVGGDIIDYNYKKANQTSEGMPYLTCEIGPGVQVTYHRRTVIAPEDVYALSLCILGSGANMLGYYVFRGGYNPYKNSQPLQESKVTGYYNDYPLVSYDFQAPIGAAGQIRRHYFLLKDLFDFCNSFGDVLAPMDSYLPKGGMLNVRDKTTVRAAVRTDGESGFLFVNNHNHIEALPEKNDITFNIILQDRSVKIFVKRIESGACFYIPFLFKYKGLEFEYATVVPISKSEDEIVFKTIRGIEPAMYFSDGTMLELKDNMVVGGIKIRIVEDEEYRITQGERLEVVPQAENKESFECFENLGLVDNTREYKVKWKRGTKFLKIDWRGNIAAAYAENVLICDNYFYGEPWIINVSDIEKCELVLKIQPLSDEDVEKIYFMTSVDAGHFIPDVYSIGDDAVYI